MKKNAVVILLIVLLALCILIGGAVLVILMDIKGGPDDKEDANKDNDQVIEELYKFTIDERTITNIKNSKKVVVCRLVIELSDNDECLLLENNSYKVTNLLIEVLRSISEIEYKDDNIQKKVEAKIKKSIEEELAIKSIVRVYFNEFLTQ